MAAVENKQSGAVVIPNWNGETYISDCLYSLQEQTVLPHIIVVDNGSSDGSLTLIQKQFPNVELISLPQNTGFSGGVNVGIRRAIEKKYDFVGLFNNDAVANPTWFAELLKILSGQPESGIATCKLMDIDKTYLDSTGECYTLWGLPYARGRGEPVANTYDSDTSIFGASGGASLYRVKMLEQIGLFDEDFFAYYEDVDISFRAQLAGWKVAYVPAAEAYHATGTTSAKIKGFTTYQTMKNLPLLFWKNVPGSLLAKMLPRFTLAYIAFFFSALQRGQGWVACKGFGRMLALLPGKLIERQRIQKDRNVSIGYIRSMLTWDLPPNAHKLRVLRAKWWKLSGRSPR